jgi:hypothetical protein
VGADGRAARGALEFFGSGESVPVAVRTGTHDGAIRIAAIKIILFMWTSVEKFSRTADPTTVHRSPERCVDYAHQRYLKW